ncbi:MAG: hypothetical protein NTY05_08625 [Rhodocyclales bacterium]|nr:hypothetical protein [Rhodocyclales bacterium]
MTDSTSAGSPAAARAPADVLRVVLVHAVFADFAAIAMPRRKAMTA